MQAVAVFKSDYEVFGLSLRAQTRSSSCLAAGYNRHGVVKLLAALCKKLLCLKVTARYLGSHCGLKLGRQAAWRPGTIGMVSSSLLAALCKQLLCLKVTTRYLGSHCGLKLGRQAAWRSGTIGMVSSSLLAALCKQLHCFVVLALVVEFIVPVPVLPVHEVEYIARHAMGVSAWFLWLTAAAGSVQLL